MSALSRAAEGVRMPFRRWNAPEGSTSAISAMQRRRRVTRALFPWHRKSARALRNDNEFVKIMGYRSMDIPDGMSREQKEFYRKMKELHKLPYSRAEQERLRELERILMGDGKL